MLKCPLPVYFVTFFHFKEASAPIYFGLSHPCPPNDHQQQQHVWYDAAVLLTKHQLFVTEVVFYSS